jgi:dihydrofolate synthase/folylpolyglutamate synthase
MTYEEALAYWFAQANYEQRAPAAGDLKLERMRALLSRLGDPHRRLRVVHVAGSKGKGSTSAMLAAILGRAGYRTGLFTSPHLSRHEERFQIDGRPISPAELAQLLTEIRQVVESHRDFAHAPPTFFELATAAGFLHFVRRRVGAAVLEVGLGGRLDSTNVCVPAVSVITSISHDHTHILGDRLPQIAREKAGIVKPGRPAVSGATGAEARAVIEEVCRQRRAPLTELGRHFHYAYRPGRVTDAGLVRPRVTVTTALRRWPEMEVNLLGEHQAANAAVAVATVEQLVRLGWHVPDGAVTAGLAGVFWPARLEVVGRRPLVVLDCAHNVASAEALAETLGSSFPPGRRLLVFAGSGDKDTAGMFRVLGPLFARAFVTRFSNNPRSVPPEQLATLWAKASQSPVEVCPTPAEALARARGEAAADDLICVTGSVFLAGEVRPLLVGGG